MTDPEAHYDNYGRGATALPKVSPAFALPAGLSRSLLLGVLGMPGNTAYFGLLDICQPQARLVHYYSLHSSLTIMVSLMLCH